jgi:hypothetical protein
LPFDFQLEIKVIAHDLYLLLSAFIIELLFLQCPYYHHWNSCLILKKAGNMAFIPTRNSLILQQYTKGLTNEFKKASVIAMFIKHNVDFVSPRISRASAADTKGKYKARYNTRT